MQNTNFKKSNPEWGLAEIDILEASVVLRDAKTKIAVRHKRMWKRKSLSFICRLTRTADININAQKTPVTIVTSDKQRASMQQIYKKWSGLEPFILIDKTLDPDLLRVLKTDAPIVFDKLQIQKHEIWNECMTFLGVNNANMNKRERLVADEVSANNEQIAISAAVQLKAREQAAKEINRIFGTDIKVSLRKIEMPELPELKGVNAE